MTRLFPALAVGLMALVAVGAVYEYQKSQKRIRITAAEGAEVLWDLGELIERIHFHPEDIYRIDGDIAVISRNIPLGWWDALGNNGGIRTITDAELQRGVVGGNRVSLLELRLGAPTQEGHEVIRIYSAEYYSNTKGDLFVKYGESPAMFTIVKTHGKFRPVYIPPVGSP
ncbi:MAG: hypothetical protein MI807_04200 [Verrucomicrobiales bacterium]|nr:hypothetical protein [Verrucomicrobiales bacterium]